MWISPFKAPVYGVTHFENDCFLSVSFCFNSSVCANYGVFACIRLCACGCTIVVIALRYIDDIV